MTFKLPDFINLTGRTCPKHGCPTYYDDNGKERCGGCDLYKAHKRAMAERDAKLDPNKLDDYNKDKAEKRHRRQEKQDGKANAYKD